VGGVPPGKAGQQPEPSVASTGVTPAGEAYTGSARAAWFGLERLSIAGADDDLASGSRRGESARHVLEPYAAVALATGIRRSAETRVRFSAG